MYENKKLDASITKEFSIGFGKLGEHRFAVEYSLLFGGNIKNHLRFSYKYDLLLKENIQPSTHDTGNRSNFCRSGIFH